MVIQNGKINLTNDCNTDCHCSGFAYTPVCWEETGDTFFNPCVASCSNYSKAEKVRKLLNENNWSGNNSAYIFQQSVIMGVNALAIKQKPATSHKPLQQLFPF